MSKLNELDYDPRLAVNQGVVIPKAAIPAKATNDILEDGSKAKTWNSAYIPADSVVNNILPALVVLINAQGAATPAKVTGFVKWTTNGNAMVTVKRDRDAIPAEAKVARQAASADAKAAWQSGTKAPKAAPAVKAAPVMANGAPAPASAPKVMALVDTPTGVAIMEVKEAPAPAQNPMATTGLSADDIANLRKAGFSLADIMAELASVTKAIEGGIEGPAAPKVASIPKGGKGGTLAPKVAK